MHEPQGEEECTTIFKLQRSNRFLQRNQGRSCVTSTQDSQHGSKMHNPWNPLFLVLHINEHVIRNASSREG